MNENTKETAMTTYTADDSVEMISALTAQTLTFCSFKPTDDKEQVALFNIMNTPEGKVADMINKQIHLKDIYCEPVDIVNEKTGELTVCPRIVLIDKDNKGYQAVSLGIYRAVKQLIVAFGQPTWTKPVKVEVKQISKSVNGETRNILTLKAVI